MENKNFEEAKALLEESICSLNTNTENQVLVQWYYIREQVVFMKKPEAIICPLNVMNMLLCFYPHIQQQPIIYGLIIEYKANVIKLMT
ncbi:MULTISPECIES: hypothetical protein [spotted fever group]|uniref:Uncharacterized protein n=1 Tax=Rickettsia rhipicephali str. Ect TaxID=1359199 RepID=A0A0F3PGD7_RICRH|nr:MULTISPECIES: hypothetical protein [spotted fever group]KJV79007.1 hypothetical protein RMAECT_1045 [Rickettsia rhipicephali str. Ect]